MFIKFLNRAKDLSLKGIFLKAKSIYCRSLVLRLLYLCHSDFSPGLNLCHTRAARGSRGLTNPTKLFSKFHKDPDWAFFSQILSFHTSEKI